jgi:peptidoglycan hydrolase-like protein with peptidoglycan-binding domain
MNRPYIAGLIRTVTQEDDMTELVRGLDAATILTPYARTIADNGFGNVGRYLKSLTVAEVAALHAVGLGVWLIFETTATRALDGGPAGSVDGARSALQAQALGAPPGTAIYTTVDIDPSVAQLAAVSAYFAAYAAALGPYKLGGYADGAVLDKTHPQYPWLSGAMGWQGSRQYLAAHPDVFRQGPEIKAGQTASWNDLAWPAMPFAYDPNICAGDIGAWLPAGAAPVAAIAVTPPPSAPRTAVETIIVAPSFTTAVRAFQASKGLAADGVIGRNTLRALYQEKE